MSNIDLKKITTEKRNPNTLDIDSLSTKQILTKINEEDKIVAYVVEKEIDKIAILVDKVVESIENGGRLIYVGAGTSGRIGVVDAAECHPTFGCDYEMVQAIIAGGEGAFIKAVEGAEDNPDLAVSDLKNVNLSQKDIVIGIAASGRTPYTIGAIKYANSLGCNTGCITTSIDSALAKEAKYPVEAVTGAEVLMGSTRMKSGTAQKLICNMITTASMIKLGRVYSNLLIDMIPSNNKLRSRSINILIEALGITEVEASDLLDKYGNMKCALVAGLTGIENRSDVEKIIKEHQGNVQEIIKSQK